MAVKRFIRQNIAYVIAILVGFLSVPVFMYFNVWYLIADNLLKLLFVISGLTIIIMLWLLKLDFPRRTPWVLMEAAILIGMIPLVFGSGMFLYDTQFAWQGEKTHWHADFDMIVDGEEYVLIDPRVFCKGDYLCKLANYTGTADIHSHGDQRIHIEGPVKRPADVTLGKFFDAFGGTLTATEIRYPTDDGWVNRTNADGKTLKVLVQQGEGIDRRWCVLSPKTPDVQQCENAHTGESVSGPEDYLISPHEDGPTDYILFIYDEVSVEDALVDRQVQ